MSSFSVGASSASGTITAGLGENILRVLISDNEGNSRQKLTTFYMDNLGTPPVISIINPMDGGTLFTKTPEIRVEFYDLEAGIDLSTLNITVNGVSRTSMFSINTEGSASVATWQVPLDYSLSDGANIVLAQVSNLLAQNQQTTANTTVASTCVDPVITGISPSIAVHGETVSITGTNFSDTVSDNTIEFFKGVTITPSSATSTQLTFKVPQTAQSGPMKVTVGDCSSGDTIFSIGLRYGFVTNFDNNWVSNGYAGNLTVIDFDDNSPGDTINYIPSGSKPFDVAVSPDGGRAFVTDNAENKVRIIDTSKVEDSDTVLITIDINNPRYIQALPDSMSYIVGTDDGLISLVDLRTGDTISNWNIGGDIKDIAISPTLQRAYVVKSTGSSSPGAVYFIDIDPASNNYLDITQITGTNYYKPTGMAIKPDQSEVYVANNRSDGTTGQAFSYSVFNADGSAFIRTQGATLDPFNDNFDVNWALEMAFDPLGRLFYSSFSEGRAGDPPGGTSNNVGVQQWPANGTNFHAATEPDYVLPHHNPKGMAFSPGGKFAFTALYGLYEGSTAYGEMIMVLDHNKVKQAIEGDSGDGRYNLTGTGPESLDDLNSIAGYANTVRYLTGFDGPQNIAFQEFRAINIYPGMIHLAEGGVATGQNIATSRVHPIFGDSVIIGLSDGTTMEVGDTVDTNFHEQWFAPNRQVYGTTADQDNTIILSATDTGIGKLIADVEGYPSNLVFVTIPPQNNIQMMVGEQIVSSTNDLTQLSLISVVRNRLRLPRRIDHDNNAATPEQFFGFPHSIQVKPSNASEELVADQLEESITCRHFNAACTWAGEAYTSYDNSRQRSILDGDTRPYHDQRMDAYDLGVKYAGWTMMDLLRTGMDDDIYEDPTGGCFSYWSPSTGEWEINLGDGVLSINEVLNGETGEGALNDFPNANDLIGDRVCGTQAARGMLYNFCDNAVEDNSSNRARYLQIVVINGVATYPSLRPHFVYLRLRSPSEPAVVRIN